MKNKENEIQIYQIYVSVCVHIYAGRDIEKDLRGFTPQCHRFPLGYRVILGVCGRGVSKKGLLFFILQYVFFLGVL